MALESMPKAANDNQTPEEQLSEEQKLVQERLAFARFAKQNLDRLQGWQDVNRTTYEKTNDKLKKAAFFETKKLCEEAANAVDALMLAPLDGGVHASAEKAMDSLAVQLPGLQSYGLPQFIEMMFDSFVIVPVNQQDR